MNDMMLTPEENSAKAQPLDMAVMLSEKEVETLVFEGHPDLELKESKEGEEHRWFRVIYEIFQQKSTGKYFRITWHRGLTEMQEHEFPDQVPVEVEPVQVVSTDYIPVVK